MKTIKTLYSLSFLFLLCTVSYAQEFTEACGNAETIYSLSEALQQKDKIQKLDLSMQKLTALPLDVTELSNLECLDLSFNKFTTLPPEFAKLKKLSYLNLTGTRYLAKVPAVLKDLPNLKILDLRDHPEWGKAQFDAAKKLLPNVTILTQ